MARPPNFEDLVSDYKDAGKKPWNGLKVVVMDPKTGDVMVNAGGDLSHDPASLTKLMTFYIAQRAIAQGHVSLNDPITIRNRVSYSKVELGDRLTLDTALKAMMTASDNRVTQAISDMIGSNINRNFAAHANATAERIGMNSTRFFNSHGLPGYYANPDTGSNTSTAHDMALLMQQIHKEFPNNLEAYMGTNSVTYDGGTYRAHHHLNRSSPLLGLPEGMEASAKTGYTRAAQHNIASLITTDHGEQLIAVVMGGGWTSRSARVAMDLPVGHAGAAKGSEVRDALVVRLAEHFLDNDAPPVVRPAPQQARVARVEQATEQPVAATPEKQPSAAPKATVEDDANKWPHTVKAGENLGLIAKRYGVSIADIVTNNRLTNANHIEVGEAIEIPQVASYRVQAGDTLSEIAERFGTTMDTLKRMNGTERDTVILGRRMAIPAVAGVVAKGSNIFDTAKAVMENACSAIDYHALRGVVYSMNDRDNDVVREGQQLFFPRKTPCKGPAQ